MNMMLNLVFNMISLFFIWVEYYHIKNRDRIYLKFHRDKKYSKLDMFFYYSKISYMMWILIGTFTQLRDLFLYLLIIGILKFIIILFKSKTLNRIYDNLNFFVSLFILIIIFIKGIC